MNTRSEGFAAKDIDEQIDQKLFVVRNQQTSSEANVVQDLQQVYMQIDSLEQVRRSLDAIRDRLEAQMLSAGRATVITTETKTQSQFQPEMSEEAVRASGVPLRTALNQEIVRPWHDWPEGQATPSAVRSLSGHQGRRKWRSTLALSSLAAVVLLSLFSWVLVTHLVMPRSTVTGSGSGSPVTTTPVPVTPVPQNLRTQVQQLLQQFHKEVSNWGNTHMYQDPKDGHSYSLDYAYAQQGLGKLLDENVQAAQSTADFQAVITLLQNSLYNLQSMESNANDSTPWNQTHQTDLNLLSHYRLNSGIVIVVSLLEQSMRVYQNGRLLESFQVTTGRYEVPSLPGSWKVMNRQTNVVLRSSEPPNSPLWYPPMDANYVLQYHTLGYMIYDSPWRAVYGSGTNFPHTDPNSSAQAGDGSVGGVNLSPHDMAKLYQIAPLNTPVIIY